MCAGDKVFYPSYGVVTIGEVTEKQILGRKCQCYVIKIASPQMNLIVPVEEAQAIGLRQIIPCERVNDVMNILQRETKEKDLNKPDSYHIKKVKSSNIFDIAESIRDLFCKNAQESLSGQGRRYLDKGLSILGSEIACAKDINKGEAKKLILDSCEEGLRKHRSSKK